MGRIKEGISSSPTEGFSVSLAYPASSLVTLLQYHGKEVYMLEYSKRYLQRPIILGRI